MAASTIRNRFQNRNTSITTARPTFSKNMGKAASDIRNFFQRLPKATKVEETAKNLNNLGKPILKGLQKVPKLVMEPLRSHKLLPPEVKENDMPEPLSEPLLSPEVSEPLLDISDAEHGSPIRKRHEVDDYYTKQMRQLEGYTEIETMSETGCDPGNPAEPLLPPEVEKNDMLSKSCSKLEPLFPPEVKINDMSSKSCSKLKPLLPQEVEKNNMTELLLPPEVEKNDMPFNSCSKSKPRPFKSWKINMEKFPPLPETERRDAKHGSFTL